MTSALGGGVEVPKKDVVKKLYNGGCVNLQMIKRGGVQKSKNFEDVV